MRGNTSTIRTAVPILSIILLAAFCGFIIAKASITASLLLTAVIGVAVVSFLNVEVALYILIVSMLLSPEFMIGSLAGGSATASRGITIRFDDVLLVVIGFGWFFKTAINKELGLFLKTPLNVPIAAYISICLISTMLGFMMGRVKIATGFFFVLKYFEYYIVYFMVVNHLKERKQIERFVAVMLIVCGIVCLVAITQIPAGGRVTAPFEGGTGEPNTLGGYLVFMLSIVLGLLATSESTGYKKSLAVLAVLIVISLLATLSRSSWIAVIPMLIALILFSKKKLALVAILIAVILLAPFSLPKAVKERVLFTVTQRYHKEQIEIAGIRIDTSTSDRLRSWKNVLTNDFIRHPLFGYGITGYRFLDAQFPRVIVETGMIGLSVFVWLLITIFKSGLHVYRNTTEPLFNGLALGFLAGFVALLAHAVGSNTFIIVRIMEPFWFLTAVVIMIPSIATDERKVHHMKACDTNNKINN